MTGGEKAGKFIRKTGNPGKQESLFCSDYFKTPPL
jgi:hypothetical protein